MLQNKNKIQRCQVQVNLTKIGLNKRLKAIIKRRLRNKKTKSLKLQILLAVNCLIGRKSKMKKSLGSDRILLPSIVNCSLENG